jgi:hypothetical protein
MRSHLKGDPGRASPLEPPPDTDLGRLDPRLLDDVPLGVQNAEPAVSVAEIHTHHYVVR